MKQLLILILIAVSSTVTFGQRNAAELKQKKQHSTAAKTRYVCPTHPEVVSSKPGVCAKCGTKLVVERQGSKQAELVTYSCPMHSQVVSNEAGKCPKCGMNLEKQKSRKEE